MSYAADLAMDRPGGILPPLALSIVLHALIALLFVVMSVRAPQPAATPFEVQILRPEEAARTKAQSSNQNPAKAPAEQPIAPPKKQIVSPSDSPEQKPDQARLFSDRDSRAIEETIKHGEPAPPAKPPQEIAKPQSAKAAAADQAATKSKGDAHGAKLGSALAESNPKSSLPSTQTAPPVGLGDLFVRPSELARDPALLKGDSADAEKTAEGGKRDLAMLDRPDLWADPGRRGAPDYLPNVREGNLTMLNAKADRFAPFVRRVGLRVFQGFSMEFKSQILSGAVPAGKDNVQVEAVMSRDGKRTDVYLRQHNGDLSADRVLLGNLNDKIFFDENPPAEAVAADGRIHFVFALDAVVSYGDRSGGRQRGAQWVMGAGLL
jgi:hypothetical protein